MKALKKFAFIGWGGKYLYANDKEDSVARPTIGYTKIMGILPYPVVGVRLGKRDGTGVTLGSGIGMDNGIGKKKGLKEIDEKKKKKKS